MSFSFKDSDLYDSKCAVAECGSANIYSNYSKSPYKDEQWKKIKLFEGQFAIFKRNSKYSTQATTKEKWEYFNLCKAAAEVGNLIHPLCCLSIVRNAGRKTAAHALNSILLHVGGKIHRPEIIERHVKQCLENHLKLKGAICAAISCPEQCQDKDGVIIFTECRNDIAFALLNDISALLWADLTEHHGLPICKVIFVQNGSIVLNNSVVQRFQTRDLFYGNKLEEEVIHVSSDKTPVQPERDDVCKHCDTCFSEHRDHIDTSLGISTFKVRFVLYYTYFIFAL